MTEQILTASPAAVTDAVGPVVAVRDADDRRGGHMAMLPARLPDP